MALEDREMKKLEVETIAAKRPAITSACVTPPNLLTKRKAALSAFASAGEAPVATIYNAP